MTTPDITKWLAQQAAMHYQADCLRAGNYASCSIGCMIRDAVNTGLLPIDTRRSEHAALAELCGVPVFVVQMVDYIFEHLPEKDRGKFHLEFWSHLNPAVVDSQIQYNFLRDLLNHSEFGPATVQTDNIDQVAKMYLAPKGRFSGAEWAHENRTVTNLEKRTRNAIHARLCTANSMACLAAYAKDEQDVWVYIQETICYIHTAHNMTIYARNEVKSYAVGKNYAVENWVRDWLLEHTQG